MSQRPALKLKLTTAPPKPPPGSTPTPSTSTPKLKLKFSSAPKPSENPSASPATQPKPKAGRKPKAEKSRRVSQPTSKKRDLEASIQSDDEDHKATSKTGPLANVKRIKLNTRSPTTPFIRLKGRGRPPLRPFGVGYDSEASDREEDPAIEEEFILRMAPGPDCDYLRQAVQERRFGPRSEGGADVRMRFLDSEGRRSVVTIQGRHYAATMVDLPCIVEAMKSWDRRGWWKTADICQMLLVLGRVDKEEDANHYPLPSTDLDEKTWQYAHGLTPPMHWVRRRRFRKRASKPAIEEVEDKVEEHLRKDEECEESHYQMIDEEYLRLEQSRRASSEVQAGYNMLSNAGMQEDRLEYGSQDAEGDLDDSAGYFETGGTAATGITTDDADDGLEADLEQAMMMDYSDAVETPNSAAPGGGQASQFSTAASNNNNTNLSASLIAPSFSEAHITTQSTTKTNIEDTSGEDTYDAAAAAAAAAMDEDDDEDDDDDEEEEDDDDEDEEELDDDALEQQQELQRQREEIADLEAAIRGQETELERVQTAILKQKLSKKIQSLRADLALKRAAIGEDVGDD